MLAFWALIPVAVYGGLLWWGAYPPRDWLLTNYVLQGIYIAGVVGSLVRFWLAARGTGGGAVKMVERQMQRQSVKWRAGARRQF
ncbi:MAG: hypothetical protein ACREC0_00395 [Methylocella sp.]